MSPTGLWERAALSRAQMLKQVSTGPLFGVWTTLGIAFSSSGFAATRSAGLVGVQSPFFRRPCRREAPDRRYGPGFHRRS